MKTRILTGLVLTAVVLGLLFEGPANLVMAVIVGGAIWAYTEFDRLFFNVKSIRRRFRMSIFIALSLVAIRQDSETGWLTLWGCFVVFGVSQIFFWGKRKEHQAAVRAIALEWLGYAYILGIFGFLMPIFEMMAGRKLLLLLCLIVFGGDTVAYFIGKRFGKTPLAPNLSPKKSVEGALAATLLSLLIPIPWAYYALGDLSWRLLYPILLMAPVVSCLAQISDLFESLLKRSQAQKDSGSILPGHGGVLDRVDGLALSAPFYYLYVVKVLGAG